MADIKVEDLMRSIRERAREDAAQQAESSLMSQDSTTKPFSRLQTSLTITERTHDQLPPVTTYRSGFMARVELWIKRQLKRASHWYTWEQVNFNSSVHSALNNTLVLLRTYEERMASLQNELDLSLTAKAALESRLIELESTLALIENRFEEGLAEKIAACRIEQRKDVDLLLTEQHVCFKQLALEISEAGVIADRAKRSIQLRLEELAGRIDKLTVGQHEVNPVEREAADNRDLL